MTLRELLDTLKGLGATLTLHDGDTISSEPFDILTPAVRAALTEHHVALVALIRSGPASPSSFDTLMTAFDGLGARPSPEILQERLRTLAAGLAGADPLVRELVRAEAIARLAALGVRAAARLVDAALTARLSDSGRAGPGRWLLVADPDPWPEAVEGGAYEPVEQSRAANAPASAGVTLPGGAAMERVIERGDHPGVEGRTE